MAVLNKKLTFQEIESWLDDDFLADFKGKQPKWGYDGLGYIINLRTYARKREDGSLEDWWETVKRVTLGNFLMEIDKGRPDWTITKEEVQQFYHFMFNLIILPPGRGLWMSGTEFAKRTADAMNNCWGTIARPHPFREGGEARPSFPFAFLFDQAMKGGGVGISVERKYTNLMPKVGHEVNIRFVVHHSHKDVDKMKNLKIKGYDIPIEVEVYQVMPPPFNSKNGKYLRVEDSREGWTESLIHTIDTHFDEISTADELVIDITDVREEGAPIKTFGGIASGPMPLIVMLASVNRILNNGVGRKLRPTEWADIAQLIGTCVVAGNVRRTAIIIVGDKDDKEFIQSKNYSLEENLVASQWRWASNNSIDISPMEDRKTLREMAVNIFYNGEPGYVNKELAQNYGRIIDGFKQGIDKNVAIFNPCGEIPLEPEENCNLFEVNLPRIEQLIQSEQAGEWLYEQALELATRYTYRITFGKYDWQSTRNVISRNRRLGVSLAGVTDWILLRHGNKAVEGFNEEGYPIYNDNVAKDLDWFYSVVKKTNREHAKALGSNPSIKLTTIKPSGTASILLGVSAGMHYHWSKYMIRRVRLASNSPLVDALLQCGYKVEPAIEGRDKDGNPVYSYNTVVAEFPIKAPTADLENFQSAYDVPLIEQASLQALLATYWADNAVSATLNFHKPMKKVVQDGKEVEALDEEKAEEVIEEITDVLDRFKTVIKSTSLLPHDTGTYDQMPLETIDEETYHKMKSKITGKPWEVLTGRIFEDNSDIDESMECIGGHCPVR